MNKFITNPGQWKQGQSGNPKGRKPKGRALTDLLRLKGEETVTIGGTVMTAQEALARAVWQFVLTGEVWLSGKRIEAQSAAEWANVVRWMYSHIEPATMQEAEAEAEPEIIVRVMREDRTSKALTLSHEGAKAQSEE